METCKICGSMLDGVWVDMQIGGVHRRLCQQCAGKDLRAAGTGPSG